MLGGEIESPDSSLPALLGNNARSETDDAPLQNGWRTPAMSAAVYLDGNPAFRVMEYHRYIMVGKSCGGTAAGAPGKVGKSPVYTARHAGALPAL